MGIEDEIKEIENVIDGQTYVCIAVIYQHSLSKTLDASVSLQQSLHSLLPKQLDLAIRLDYKSLTFLSHVIRAAEQVASDTTGKDAKWDTVADMGK
jgi:hypothetical protein